MRRVVVPEHIKEHLGSLRRAANGLRGLFGVPIWLCGSALRGTNPKPRDWDIRITLSDDDFKRHFGIEAKQWAVEGASGEWTEGRWRWSDECVKQSVAAYRQTGLNIDLQIYPAWYVKRHYKSMPKMRLDTRRAPRGKPQRRRGR